MVKEQIGYISFREQQRPEVDELVELITDVLCSPQASYRMLYHDMTNQATVHYVQEDSIEQTVAMIHELEGKLDAFEQRLRTGYRPRIVTNQNSLREKTLIFKRGLDDRVIELAKIFLIAHAGQQHPDAEFTDVFFNENEGNYFLSSSENNTCKQSSQAAFTKKSQRNYSIDLPKKTHFL